MKKQLFQLHWQFNDRTEMIAQNEISNQAEMDAWTERVFAEHPKPKGAIWMMCNENSKHFVMAVCP